MARKNAFYAQSGGVTAVINASACGVIETCRRHKNRIGKVYAGRHGVVGALTEDLIDTSKDSAAAIRALRHTPSGAFGSARYKLKKYEEQPAQYEARGRPVALADELRRVDLDEPHAPSVGELDRVPVNHVRHRRLRSGE